MYSLIATLTVLISSLRPESFGVSAGSLDMSEVRKEGIYLVCYLSCFASVAASFPALGFCVIRRSRGVEKIPKCKVLL